MTTSQQYLINGGLGGGISPLDRGFAYGDGVFRTLPIHHGQPLHWPLHYNKLANDCSALDIVCPDMDVLAADISVLFGQEEKAVAKIIITRGESSRGYAVPAVAQPTRVVIKSAMPDYPVQNSNDGIALHLCKLRLPHQPAYAGIKHLNRLENILARKEWSDASFADGLLLDTKGNAIECTMSNIFARYGNNLFTPDLSLCGVAGVTRQRILDAVAGLGLRPAIKIIPFDTLLQADEVIVCNSLYGTWQVRSIAERVWDRQDTASQLRAVLEK